MSYTSVAGISLALLASFGIATAQSGAPTATLSSTAFSDAPTTGVVVRFSAHAEGGTPPYQYDWDLDGDGANDRSSSAAVIEATFPRSGTFEVSVTVRDASGLGDADQKTLHVRGPRLRVEPVGELFGPAELRPGDFSVAQFVEVTNIGDAPQPAGHVMFVPVSSGSDTRPAALVRRSLVPVPELAVGEAAQLMLGFSTDLQAQCGQEVSIDYLGSLWADGQTFERQRVVSRQIADPCTSGGPGIGPILMQPQVPPIERRSALYFNPARPGNGLFNQFTYRGSPSPFRSNRREAYAGAWFTALRDRTPVWYLLDGELVEGTGILTVRRPFNSAAPEAFSPDSEVVGRAWSGRLDSKRVAFAWELDDGSNGIEWMDTGSNAFSGPNHTQSWFNSSEPGWGLAIETLYVRTPLEFIGAFIYDVSGEPRWLSGELASFVGGEVALTSKRPHCPACPWIVDWNIDSTPAGTLQINYTAATQATLETSIQLLAPYQMQWQRSGLLIRPIATPGR